MTLIMKRSQSKGGKVQCSSSHNRKKKLTPTDQRWQPAGTCNTTGPGTCLHLGQLLPGRSLCRLLCHFGKNPPPEGWLLRISEGVTLVLLQLGGMPGPRPDSKDRTKHFPRPLLPSAPQLHDTQSSSRSPKTSGLCSTAHKSRCIPSSSGGQSATGRVQQGSQADVSARGRTPPQSPVFLGAYCAESRRALTRGQRKSPCG